MSPRSVTALLLLQGTLLVVARSFVLPSSRDEAQRIHGWGPALLRKHFPKESDLLEKIDGLSDGKLGKHLIQAPVNNNLEDLQHDPVNNQAESQPNWTTPQNACINSSHKKFLGERVSSLEQCKTRCIEDTDIVCRSVGYISTTRSCSLSWKTSTTAKFTMPCDHKDYTYVERIFDDTKYIAPDLTMLVDERSSLML